MQISTPARNARLDAIETTVGTSPILTIRTGATPATCATANSGTVLATITLPADWLAAASGGVKALAGVWQDPSADAGGTAQHFRIHDSTGTTCHIQGSVSATGGGGDMVIDNITIVAGQQVNVTGFTLTDPNG